MTGGQWSALRLVLGVTLAATLPWPAAPFALALALGVLPRLAALALLAAVALAGPNILALPLVLHVVADPRPYGALPANGRTDPDGGWRAPESLWLVRLIFTAILATVGVRDLMAGGTLWPVALVAWPCFGVRRLRAAAWLTTAVGAGLLLGHAWAIVVIALFDPRSIPSLRDAEGPWLFYDGGCGLCHRGVRFVLAEDTAGAVRFAPLGSAVFEDLLTPSQKLDLPDSMVARLPDGSVHVRSASAFVLCDRLGGLWRLLAIFGRLVPREIWDAIYSVIAGVRHRLFTKPAQACPILPPHLRARFHV